VDVDENIRLNALNLFSNQELEMNLQFTHFWTTPCYIACFASAFADGTDLEGGSLLHCLFHIRNALKSFISTQKNYHSSHFSLGLKGPFYNGWKEKDLDKLSELASLLDECYSHANKLEGVKSAENLSKFVENLTVKINGLSPNQGMLLPGGWKGTTSASYLIHSVKRTSSSTFSFTTYDKGAGLKYHPSEFKISEHCNNRSGFFFPSSQL
jgi:hypothetical protein